MPANFLDLPETLSNYANAKVVLLPIPYEQTVTYGKGTAKGPAAIIDASSQIEFYDREFNCEPVNFFGIHTLPAVDKFEKIYIMAIKQIENRKFLVGLGGEHSVSAPLVKAQAENSEKPITVVQIDAHSDLRDSYLGSKNNHACVARRFFETENVERIIQFGVRSISTEEINFIKENTKRIKVFFAEDMDKSNWKDEFFSLISGKQVYLSIDVDGLDPSVIAATGTPEPGGLTWRKTLDIIRTLSNAANLIGFDCVELAPQVGMHASDYATAKLVYKTLAIKYNSK